MKKILLFSLVFIIFFMNVDQAFAASGGLLEVKVGDEGDWTSSLKIFVMVTLITLAPSFIIMFTCFPFVTIVLGLTRQALGTMNMPPNQVIMGLSLFITLYLMNPVIMQIKHDAYDPYDKGKITTEQALKVAEEPLKKFMIANTYDGDLKVFLKLRNDKLPKVKEDVSIWAAVPAFQLTQISKGFFVGLMIYAAFSFVDMIVGSILMFMGMIMLPPQMISLPLKLLIFVFIGGFGQIVEIIFNSIKT
jgi:flagellar biosynthetic protein FliP